MRGELVIGVLYPLSVHRERRELDVELERLAALDSSVRVLVDAGGEDGVPAITAQGRGLTDRQREVLRESEVLLALNLPAAMPSLAPRLRWVQAISTGVDHLRGSGLADAGVLLTTAAGTAAPEIAEFVMARVLEHAKRLHELSDDQTARRWQPRYGTGLTGRTIGLVGFGALNQEVARRALAFGMRVVVARRSHDAPVEGVDDVVPLTELAEMAQGCDVLVSALPEMAATERVLSRQVLEALPAGAFVCNIGRGGAVDDEALVELLECGHLGGAALDVFREEPLPADHSFWTTPGLRISSHCASDPAAAIRRTHELFRENVSRYLVGTPLLNCVDPVAGSPNMEGAHYGIE